MTSESVDEPPNVLREALRKHGIERKRVIQCGRNLMGARWFDLWDSGRGSVKDELKSEQCRDKHFNCQVGMSLRCGDRFLSLRKGLA